MLQNLKNITTVEQNKRLEKIGINDSYADNILSKSFFSLFGSRDDNKYEHYGFSFARLMDLLDDNIIINKNYCKYDYNGIVHIVNRPNMNDLENPYIEMLVLMLEWIKKTKEEI